MASIASVVLTTIAVLLALPCAVFAIEVVASLFCRPRQAAAVDNRDCRIAVLVPAHDEASGIAKTLAGIRAQLRPNDRLVVVADNCSDDTSTIAASNGAEVSVRFDPERIGKGYALDWGLRHLERDAPDVVIVVDADCELAPLALDRLASACQYTGRPAQALYLMTAPIGSGVNHQVAEFAWRLKNLARPLGLAALGLPCQLMGTGMAIPWGVIRPVDLGSGNIVEDLKLGLDLARAGHAPTFWPTALVMSTFPNSAEGARKQRQRWEHGQIQLTCTAAFPLLWQAIRQRNVDLLALVSDLLVPPLSLFAMTLVTMALASLLLAFLSHNVAPLIICAVVSIIFALVTFLAWVVYGRSALPATSLARILPYLLAKVRNYVSAVFTGRTSRWIRTDRG